MYTAAVKRLHMPRRRTQRRPKASRRKWPRSARSRAKHKTRHKRKNAVVRRNTRRKQQHGGRRRPSKSKTKTNLSRKVLKGKGNAQQPTTNPRSTSRSNSKSNAKPKKKKRSIPVVQKSLKEQFERYKNSPKPKDRDGLERSICFAQRKPHESTGSCYDDDQLRKLRDSWNKFVKNKNKDPSLVIQTDSPQEIRAQLAERAKDKCAHEFCWLCQEFGEDTGLVFQDIFAPLMPKSWEKDITTWLSSPEIRDVMRQHEIDDPSFRFFGPSPIDFAKVQSNGECVVPELCKLDLRTEYRQHKKTKFGIIFNTDPSTKGGQHWFCMYIEIKDDGNKVHIEYYDSANGIKQKEIKQFEEFIRKQFDAKTTEIQNVSNTEADQEGTSECGMFSMLYILGSKCGLELGLVDELASEGRWGLFNIGGFHPPVEPPDV